MAPRTCPDCGWVWPKPKGPCPSCGSDAAPEVDLSGREIPSGEDPGPAKMPWSLKVLVAALVLYLGWRLVEGVGWVAERVSG